MPVFTYQSIEPASQRVISGSLEAANLRAAKEHIREQGQIVTEIFEDHETLTLMQLLQELPAVGKLFAPSLGLKELSIFTEQLYTLLDAGVPLIEALYLLEQQAMKPFFKNVIKTMRSDIIGGSSFSEAMSRHKQLFPKLFISMVRSGETSGELDKICLRLSVLLEKQRELREKVRSALVMPVITLVVITLVVILILVLVVPMFETMFSSRNAPLPLPTVALITCSKFLTSFWWAVLAAAFGGLAWFQHFWQSGGKPIVDQWMLTLPLLGDVIKKSAVSNFIRTLASLVGSGVSLMEAIPNAASTVDNYILNLAFSKARESILSGGTLSKPLAQHEAFPSMVVRMIAVGEQTGSLESMLLKAADYLDREVDSAVNNLTKLIEPIMTITLGGILLFVALSLFLPLWDLNNIVMNNG